RPAGRRRPPRRSLPALLDVGLYELLGVLLQHGVDLVEDLVHLLLELLALVGGLGLARLTLATAALLLGPLLLLLLRQRTSLLRMVIETGLIVGRARDAPAQVSAAGPRSARRRSATPRAARRRAPGSP